MCNRNSSNVTLLETNHNFNKHAYMSKPRNVLCAVYGCRTIQNSTRRPELAHQAACSVSSPDARSTLFHPMAKIDGNSRKERVRMLVGGNSKRRAKREGAGNKRNILPTTPLLMQLLGILHLSAVCARAAAVVGVVLSPSTTTSECSRATVVSSSPGKSMAMPSHGVVTTAITNERPPAAIVCRNVSCNRMRPRGKAPTSVNVTVGFCWFSLRACS